MITPEEYLKTLGIELEKTTLVCNIEGVNRQPDLCGIMLGYAKAFIEDGKPKLKELSASFNQNEKCPMCGFTEIASTKATLVFTNTCRRCRYEWPKFPTEYTPYGKEVNKINSNES